MKILVADNVSEQGVAILKKEHDVDVKLKLSPEELIKIIPEYDALVVRSETKVRKPIIEVANKLKVIGRAGVGVDNIDVEAATQKGIIVLNAPEGNTIAATEHTMAMMLALARNIPDAHKSLKEGKWLRSQFMGVEMRGKTLGILGLGRIGSGVAKRALAMEMKVIGYDPYITEERASAMDIELADVDKVLAEADFLTFHLPLNADTKYLLNKETFKKLKPGVRIVNCARGGVIDEVALAEAIEAGVVAGAAIDVFEKEPADPENPLFKLDKVVVTPHLGASTAEAQVGVAVDVAHGILVALRGEPVSTAVNISAVPTQVMQVIKPYLTLAEKMGCLAVQLAEGPITTVTVEYDGEISEVDTKMLTTAVLKGIFNPLLQEPVNYVNAPAMAKARGVKTKEVKSKDAEHFVNLITVRVKTAKGETEVAGTLFGKEDGRIVMIDKYRVDANPKGWLLISPHMDKPGIIGQVGSVLGNYKINIDRMQVGHAAQAGTNIMVMGVSAEITAAALDKIKTIDGIIGAKVVNFNIG
ncbi:MAG: D-3-phosphoglycerate dehydrogenase [Firmicutes bacterium]|nr:D-3-phosphoglycerate dehydrogenase [Bacillota bacterium]